MRHLGPVLIAVVMTASVGLARPPQKFFPLGAAQLTDLSKTGDAKAGAAVYELCEACHLPSGAGRVDGTFPQLAGQHTTVLLKQLADMRAGVSNNPMMHPYAITLPNRKLADVAAYIATLPVPQDNGIGPGTDVELGAQLYERGCRSCHGVRGEGDAARFMPVLAGQHYPYLLRQSTDIRDGRRKNADPEMVRLLRSFTDKELVAVTDYLSRLNMPAPKK